jgi:hypothetical protein
MKQRLLASVATVVLSLQIFAPKVAADRDHGIGEPPLESIIPKPTPIDSLAVAREYALSRIGQKQFDCLDILFTRESHWRVTALNKSSGAYGIPQALPGNKMAKAGDDWKTNPVTQVKWGLMYISGRYDTACNALQHFYSYGWY